MTTTDKRKAQQKEASANYRAKKKQQIKDLIYVIKQLINELENYKD